MKTRSDDEIVAEMRKLIMRRWLYSIGWMAIGVVLMMCGYFWVQLLGPCMGWEVVATKASVAGLVAGLFVVSTSVGSVIAIAKYSAP